MFKKLTDAFGVIKTDSGFSMMLAMVVAIVGPLFFIPVANFSVIAGKGFFITAIAIVAVIVAGVRMLRRGSVTIPRGYAFGFLAAIVGSALLGAILSGAGYMSLFGYGFETTTFLFTISFAVLIITGYFALTSHDRIIMMIGAITIPAIILAVWHIIRYIAGPAFGNFGVLRSTVATAIGSWPDLAFLFGFIIVLCVMTLELVRVRRVFKIAIGIVAMISMVMLAAMNIRSVWVIVGLLALLLALYLFSFAYWHRAPAQYDRDRKTPWYAVALFVISLVCVVFGGVFGGWANRHQNLSYSDVRPSVMMTARTGWVSFLKNPVTGYGPNMFNAAWNKTKPPVLSGKLTDTVQGSGWVPTQMATGGLLGIVAWVLFFATLAWSVIRGLLRGFENPVERYAHSIVSVSIIYLSIIVWTATPGAFLLGFFAILIGGHLAMTHNAKSTTFSFIRDPRASFFGIITMLVIIVSGMIAGYVQVRKFGSMVFYAHSVSAIGAGQGPAGAQDISRAAAWAPHDVYHADLSRIALSDATGIMAQSGGNNANVSKQAEQLLGAAVGHAQVAINANPLNYKNYVAMGDVYRFMASVGVDGSSDRAVQFYDEAKKLIPNDATSQLWYARLDTALKKNNSALQKISESIDTYPTAAAYILQAQLQINGGNSVAAIASLQNAVGLDPYNASLAYQYGLLLFQQKQYQSAIAAFSRVITLDRTAAPAYVYLGVSYEKTGDTDRANQVYELVRARWSDGAQAIAQVKSGIIEVVAPDQKKP